MSDSNDKRRKVAVFINLDESTELYPYSDEDNTESNFTKKNLYDAVARMSFSGGWYPQAKADFESLDVSELKSVVILYFDPDHELPETWYTGNSVGSGICLGVYLVSSFVPHQKWLQERLAYLDSGNVDPDDELQLKKGIEETLAGKLVGKGDVAQVFAKSHLWMTPVAFDVLKTLSPQEKQEILLRQEAHQVVFHEPSTFYCLATSTHWLWFGSTFYVVAITKRYNPEEKLPPLAEKWSFDEIDVEDAVPAEVEGCFYFQGTKKILVIKGFENSQWEDTLDKARQIWTRELEWSKICVVFEDEKRCQDLDARKLKGPRVQAFWMYELDLYRVL